MGTLLPRRRLLCLEIFSILLDEDEVQNLQIEIFFCGDEYVLIRCVPWIRLIRFIYIVCGEILM